MWIIYERNDSFSPFYCLVSDIFPPRNFFLNYYTYFLYRYQEKNHLYFDYGDIDLILYRYEILPLTLYLYLGILP